MNEIKAIASERGIKCGKLNKTDLVRTIQQQEGNPSCYNTGQKNICGQDQCLWRADCL
jgi:hypothetical protein